MNILELAVKSMGRVIPAGLLMGGIAFLLVNGPGKEPVRVGVAVQLTGVQSELGVQERNGVQLAVEEINASGGVAGRPIELIVRDDLGLPEGARTVDRELIQSGVAAIIGHTTSTQTIAGLAVTNPAHVVMISPTASTPELSGQDDYFFRISRDLVTAACSLARHVYQDRNLTRMAGIYDTDNAAYSKAYLEAFAAEYQSMGGKVVAKARFSSGAQPDFAPPAARLRAGNPDGLLIIAADIDTALIAQRTRLMDWPVPLFATAWAKTETLINNGGQAVEGLETESDIPMDNQTPDYFAFKARYKARFGEDPAFGAALGYETAKILATALQKTGGNAGGLAQVLAGIKNYKGLNFKISFDRYGDVIRPSYLVAVRDGKFVDIERLKPAER